MFNLGPSELVVLLLPLSIICGLLSIPGIIGGCFAKRKGKSFWLWFFMCAFLPFLVIPAVLMPEEGSELIEK